MSPTVQECTSRLREEFDVLGIVYCDDKSVVDLYVKIKSLHRDVYENNQRIVFIITKDVGKIDHPGQTLQNLQSMINDIDISNFFVCVVTTNPDIENDYRYVLNNISLDDVPFHLYPCSGDYEKQISDDLDVFSKYVSIRDSADKINDLQDSQKKLLFESKTFCMLAWTGINVEPNNTVRPCCEFQGSMGDSSKQSLRDIWNSEKWKKVRADMLSGTPVKECHWCYDKEKMGRDTLRKSSNRQFFEKINLVKHTDIDGNLDTFNLNYWDIRYNNLCNLSCRTCNPNASSSWYQVAEKLGHISQSRSPILIAGKEEHDIFNQIIQHIDHVEQIYFAGGEPSMIDEFYQILELLDSHSRNEVRLCYNINMSRLKLKNKSLLELWKKFPKVSIGASLDGENQRGEYLRQGLAWSDVVKNRQAMIEQCPHVDFYISSTVSMLNVLHLPDFHRSWVDKNLIRPEDFNVQILFGPRYMSIDRSPPEMKEKIKKIYTEHLDWLVSRDPVGRATYGFRSVLSYIEKDIKFNPWDFWHNIDLLDRYHNTDMLSVFPELDFLPRT